MRAVTDLPLIVPFHNESRRLPILIQALRAQSVTHVPIVFVDNGSVDGSASLIQASEEFRMGRWTLLEEPQVGKIRALRTALAFCLERFNPRSIGFVDADTSFADATWIQQNLERIDWTDEFGYTQSPVRYEGFGRMPVFMMAYLAYEPVIHQVQERIGWWAQGQGFSCSTDTLVRYFKGADITTEFDLRCSLLALSEGRRACWNPSMLLASGRRIVVNAENFKAWSFYNRDFYVKKDINEIVKVNLERPDMIDDMDPSMIQHFFERRALKTAARHLVPLAIFDRTSMIGSRLSETLGVNALEGIREIAGQLRNSLEWVFTDRFDERVRMLEGSSGTRLLAERLAALMSERYEQMSLSPVETHVN